MSIYHYSNGLKLPVGINAHLVYLYSTDKLRFSADTRPADLYVSMN